MNQKLQSTPAAVFCIIIIGLAALNISTQFNQKAAQTKVVAVAEKKVPVRLNIPQINVDAPIIKVGLTKDGSMDVPQNAYEVGWYELGASPGQKGSAVLAGHLNWKKGVKGVFRDLDKLKEGDVFSVVDDKGGVIQFIVRHTRQYNSEAYVPEVFVNNDGGTYLNLITCDGVWSRAAQNYTKRLVVFSQKLQ